ncbi:Protein of unknown function (DUF3072) [Palleronia aestuarii]|uniref:DUF3072 domain-containing protein n=1 Tax=Palleronia aestuarii TaxID=568105 RepID=A0A2W7NPT4_9RHOB|nr:DUF3072 domain-containing protein [Palleronia aestuarii]PZX15256.1 Protein of unknown function (DUF3072) [Palleronia aestuarii]
MANDTEPKTKGDPMAAAELPIGGAVVTGDSPSSDEPMTEAQAAKLRELCEARDEPFDGNLTQEQAAERIEALENGE